jgi:hypothetical protein
MLENISNIKFHDNLSSGSRFIPCGPTDTDGWLDRETHMTKLIVAFRNFANSPKKISKSHIFWKIIIGNLKCTPWRHKENWMHNSIFLNFGCNWRCATALYPHSFITRKIISYPFSRRLGGSQTLFERFVEMNLLLSGKSSHVFLIFYPVA